MPKSTVRARNLKLLGSMVTCLFSTFLFAAVMGHVSQLVFIAFGLFGPMVMIVGLAVNKMHTQCTLGQTLALYGFNFLIGFPLCGFHPLRPYFDGWDSNGVLLIIIFLAVLINNWKILKEVDNHLEMERIWGPKPKR